MKNKNLKQQILIILAILFAPSFTSADVELSGWIPYWRFSEGITSAQENLEKLETIHPFSFVVQPDGSIKDLAGMDSRKVRRFIREARSENVDVIPSVMWSDGGQMQLILSDTRLREKHVEDVVEIVEDGNYDGIDIDYEGKRAETKEYFSTFLKELKKELRGKTLSCTIEARTPPESLYTQVPTVIEYANDLREIGRHCDVVQIMAYDQGRADVKLNAEKRGAPYVPVADTDWVEKVVDLMAKEIPAEKIMLATPTYGYEYTVSTIPEQYLEYKRQWSLNPRYADEIAEKYKVARSESRAGEMAISYFPEESPFKILSALPVPAGTKSGDTAAAQALLFANYTKMMVPFNYLTWSDAGAIEDKIKLAEAKGLKGIALFKIDGGEDQDLWDLFD